jgi:hypothetical protein
LKEISCEKSETNPQKSFERIDVPKDFFKIHKSLRNTLQVIGKTLNPDTLSEYIKIDYRGDTANVELSDIKKASNMIIQSLDFIKHNAVSAVEHKTADTLLECVNSGKIFLCDTKEIAGHSVYGAFCIDTNNNKTFIAIDLNNVLDYGKAELVDTLFHEAYHAAHNAAGHKNDLIKEETRAWNLGLEMSNKYREQNGISVTRTRSYTENDMMFMGYSSSGSCNQLAEIC